MRMRPHRRNLVVWSSSVGPADRYIAPRLTRSARPRPIRWLIWMVLTHRRPVFLVTGALLFVIWMLLPSIMVFVLGLLLVGLGAPGASPLPGRLSPTAAMVRMTNCGIRGRNDTNASQCS
jgi:hypothetical protein